MLRRVHFYSICFALGASVLLILPAIICVDNSNFRGPRVRFLRRSEGADDSYNNMQPISTYPYDGPPIHELLKMERIKIELELWNLNFSLSGKKLEDLLVESGGQPQRTLIISSWRSGSSFLGEILNAIPGNFYHYEPLSKYGVMKIRGLPHSTTALNDIKKMFKCMFYDMKDYFEFERHNQWQFNTYFTTSLWSLCRIHRDLCYDTSFTAKFCKLFPFQSMKLVRLRLHLVQEIITDEKLNVKVVFLIRDPRGVMGSRLDCDFCPPSPDCWRPELLCADMISDYSAAAKLLKNHPQRLMVLRYEELALKPNETVHQILEFLGLRMMPTVSEYLHSHTTNRVPGGASTYRISRAVPFKWKRRLNFTYVHNIQLACKQAMNLWGYQMADNASHMASFNPLQNYVVEGK